MSIDFNRFKTCPQICSYCYVDVIEKIRPAYKEKLDENTTLVNENPKNFGNLLNIEYKKLRNSKNKDYERLDKLPVRVYGSGDYVPIHFEWMEIVEFKFYIISKSLTLKHFRQEIDKLLKLNNLTNIVLSFDNENINNYENVKDLTETDRITFAYTGVADDFNKIKDNYKFSIFFNISNKNIEKQKSKYIKQQCPCDSGLLESKRSCTYCNKCWRSSVTKQPEWNNV